MVYADGTTLQDVGIPAGGTVLVRFDVDEAFVTQWQSYGAMPTQVQHERLVPARTRINPLILIQMSFFMARAARHEVANPGTSGSWQSLGQRPRRCPS